MKLLNRVWEKIKVHVIYIIIIVVLLFSLSISVNKCSNASKEYKNNIEALKDTIRYYQDKNGNLVATKLAFEAELKDIKLLNNDLYEKIKSLKSKGDVTSAVYFGGIVENPQQDTSYIVSHDTIYKGFSKNFAFNNEFRTLEGRVSYLKDTVGVNIDKDEVKFDYTVALDDKNNIMIRSTNPYVRFNEITGFQLPKEKEKHWAFGAFGNFGYAPVDNDRYIDLGIFVDYRWKILSLGPIIYYQRNFATNNKAIYIGANLNVNILEW